MSDLRQLKAEKRWYELFTALAADPASELYLDGKRRTDNFGRWYFWFGYDGGRVGFRPEMRERASSFANQAYAAGYDFARAQGEPLSEYGPRYLRAQAALMERKPAECPHTSAQKT